MVKYRNQIMYKKGRIGFVARRHYKQSVCDFYKFFTYLEEYDRWIIKLCHDKDLSNANCDEPEWGWKAKKVCKINLADYDLLSDAYRGYSTNIVDCMSTSQLEHMMNYSGSDYITYLTKNSKSIFGDYAKNVF